MDLIKIVCAVILPPLGVFLQVGLTKHFWINLLLTLLGYFPGIVHAIWVLVVHAKKPLPQQQLLLEGKIFKNPHPADNITKSTG